MTLKWNSRGYAYAVQELCGLLFKNIGELFLWLWKILRYCRKDLLRKIYSFHQQCCFNIFFIFSQLKIFFSSLGTPCIKQTARCHRMRQTEKKQRRKNETKTNKKCWLVPSASGQISICVHWLFSRACNIILPLSSHLCPPSHSKASFHKTSKKSEFLYRQEGLLKENLISFNVLR